MKTNTTLSLAAKLFNKFTDNELDELIELINLPPAPTRDDKLFQVACIWLCDIGAISE